MNRLVLIVVAVVAAAAAACKKGDASKAGAANAPVAPSPTGTAPTAPPADDDCKVTTPFKGQPGTLWIDDKAGKLTVIDTATGAIVRTVQGPGWSSAIVGGNGLLWLDNLNNDRKLTPIDPSGKALPTLEVQPAYEPVYVDGAVWTVGMDAHIMPTVYRIKSPAEIATVVPNYSINGFAASADGLTFIGAPIPHLGNEEMVHVDAAATKVEWKVSIADIPAAKMALTKLVAVGGKVFVAFESGPTSQDLFSVDLASHAVSKPVTLDPGITALMTDGTGLYVFEVGTDSLVELDQTTLAAKRTLKLTTKRAARCGSAIAAARPTCAALTSRRGR
jgi:outer membrane protein assembly factor BamB